MYHVVPGATLCLLINVIQTTTTTSNVTTTTSNMTELERSMKETETILEALERAVDEAKVLFNHNNITMDVRHIDSNKDEYRNVLLQLLANNTVRSDGNTTREEGTGGEKTLTAARRHKDHATMKLFEFVSLSKKKNKHKDNQREVNRIIMQGKIDEWLLNRELEKKKIKNYIDRVRVPRLERCYREGLSKKKKKKKTRRQNDDDDEKKKDSEEEERKKRKREKREKRRKEKYSGGRLYPCCRKCCKRSYMGCL